MSWFSFFRSGWSSFDPDDVEKTLNWLQSTLLRSIRPWLEAVEAQEDTVDGVTKLLREELTAWAYDAEDVLDEWDFQQLRSNAEAPAPQATGRRYARNPATDLLMDPSFRFRVSKLKTTHNDIFKSYRDLRLGKGESSRRRTGNLGPPPSTSLLGEWYIHDREDYAEGVVEFLMSAEEVTGQRLAVVPIVGAVGVGKTSFTQRIYHDPKVSSGHFALLGWVSASPCLGLMDLMREVWESLTKEACGLSQLDLLVNRLRQRTIGRRFLLILDDVQHRTLEHWEMLRAIFTGCAGGSAIILTTQDEEVADRMRTVPCIYLSECLSKHVCWLVFQKHAFCRPPIDARLVEIGQRIAEECEGSPLVAKALGLKLRHEDDAETWEACLQGGMWDVVISALQSCYHRLPAHLKRCFVYCSMFPRGFLFKREELVRLWMAQGFIRKRGRRLLNDIGLEYFDDLFLRSFFQRFQAKNEAFVMPKHLHVLAQFISDGECLAMEDNNLCILQNKLQKARHLSLTSSGSVLATRSWLSTKHLRSFLVVQTSVTKNIVHVTLSDEVLDSLNRLRALDVSNTIIAALPNTIGNLKHLRYLNLSGTGIGDLPASVFELYNLLTLNLSHNDIMELPDLFGNLKLLCFLFLSHTKIKQLPESVCKLHNLQTLDLSFTDVGKPSEFETKRLASPPSTSHNLQTANQQQSDGENGLPYAIGNLSNLSFLDLSVTRIRKLPESIGKLPNLQTLHLSFTDIEELPETIGKLKRLKTLCLNSSKIRRLPESIHELSNLQTLELQHCTHFKELPKAIEGLTSLRHLFLTAFLPVDMPAGIGKLSSLTILPVFNLGKRDGSCRIEELKDLLYLEELGISGLCNVVNLCNVKVADLKSKEKLAKLTLRWPCSEVSALIGHLSDSQGQDAKDRKSNNHSISIDRDSEEQLDDHSDQSVLIQVVSDISDSNIKYLTSRGADHKDSSSNDVVMEDDVLENLQPHTNLRKLHVRFYGGGRFPDWMGHPSFSELTHVVLKNCMECKALPQLGLLPVLKELDIDGTSVARVGQDFCGQGDKGFPQLEKLSFQNMCKWEEWDGVGKDDFPLLGELMLFNCPKLKGVPCLHSSLTKLKVERCGVNTLPTRESLQDLQLCACDNLSGLPSLNSLRSLTLLYCQNLTVLPVVPLLEKLWIEECEQLLPCMTSLSKLKICKLSSTSFLAVS